MTALVVAVTGLFALGWVADITWMRLVFGLPVILVFPGGLALWALFPQQQAMLRERQLGNIERLVLSVALSVVVVALFGLLLESFGLFRETPFVLFHFLLLAVLLLVANLRASGLPGEEQWPALTVLPPSSSTVVLGVLALVATASVVGFMASPKDTPQYAELALLGPDGGLSCYPGAYADGAYVATTQGGANRTVADAGCAEPANQVTLAIANHGHAQRYSVVVWWVRDDGGALVAESRMDEFDVTLPQDGQQGFSKDYTLPAPPSPGDHFLVFQLHRGEAPPVIAGRTMPVAEHEVRLAILGAL